MILRVGALWWASTSQSLGLRNATKIKFTQKLTKLRVFEIYANIRADTSSFVIMSLK